MLELDSSEFVENNLGIEVMHIIRKGQFEEIQAVLSEVALITLTRLWASQLEQLVGGSFVL